MPKRHLSRRLIGLLAAYLVALQALILPLSMPVSASPAASLCVSTQDRGAADRPAGQDHGCPCAAGCGMQCHVPAPGAGAAAASLPSPQFVLAARLVPGSLPAHTPLARRGAQLPRGPPAA